MGLEQLFYGIVSMLINLAVPVVFFIAGWMDDRQKGIIIGAIALGIITLLAGLAGMLQVVVMYGLPAALITGFGNQYKIGSSDKKYWYPADRLVCIPVIYVGSIFAVATIWLSSQGKSLQSNIAQIFRQELERSGLLQQMVTDEEQTQIILSNLDQWLVLAPSVLAVCLILFIGLAAWVGYSIARRFDWTNRPDLSIDRIELPLWYLGLTGLFGLAGLYGSGEFLGLASYSFLFGNLAIMMLFAITAAGLVFGHSLIRHYGFGNIALVLFYGLFLLPGWPVMLITVIGAMDQLDQWRDWTLRSKSATNDNND